MKRLALAIALIVPAACATTSPLDTAMIERPAPIGTAQVMIGNTAIPVSYATIPLHNSLEEPESPVREHIRQLLLSAAI